MALLEKEWKELGISPSQPSDSDLIELWEQVQTTNPHSSEEVNQQETLVDPEFLESHFSEAKCKDLGEIFFAPGRDEYVVVAGKRKTHDDGTFVMRFVSGETKVQKRSREKLAKLVCSECKASEKCLDLALRNNFGSGIWAGKTVPELKALRKSLGMID